MRKFVGAIVPLLVVTAFAVVPAAASAAPHWFKGKFELTSAHVTVTTAGNLTLVAAGATIKCKVNDAEEIWNPVGGGAGEDLMTAFNFSKCKVTAGSSACPTKGFVEVLPNGLNWPSHLLAGPPIRDEIQKMRIIIRCLAGTPPDEFEGSLTPEVEKNKLVFGPGSGALTDPFSNTLEISGFDNMTAGGKGAISAK
jgi:hypothetical protein